MVTFLLTKRGYFMCLTTSYQIYDETNARSSISIFKLDGDVLQCTFNNVHLLVQKTFDEVTVNNPSLSRRKRGNLVRSILSDIAKSSSLYMQKLNDFL